MLVLGVAVALAIIGIATFPCWTFSARWGFTPSLIAGTMLFAVASIVVGGKYFPRAGEPEMALAATYPIGKSVPLATRLEPQFVAADSGAP